MRPLPFHPPLRALGHPPRGRSLRLPSGRAFGCGAAARHGARRMGAGPSWTVQAPPQTRIRPAAGGGQATCSSKSRASVLTRHPSRFLSRRYHSSHSSNSAVASPATREIDARVDLVAPVPAHGASLFMGRTRPLPPPPPPPSAPSPDMLVSRRKTRSVFVDDMCPGPSPHLNSNLHPTSDPEPAFLPSHFALPPSPNRSYHPQPVPQYPSPDHSSRRRSRPSSDSSIPDPLPQSLSQSSPPCQPYSQHTSHVSEPSALPSSTPAPKSPEPSPTLRNKRAFKGQNRHTLLSYLIPQTQRDKWVKTYVSQLFQRILTPKEAVTKLYSDMLRALRSYESLGDGLASRETLDRVAAEAAILLLGRLVNESVPESARLPKKKHLPGHLACQPHPHPQQAHMHAHSIPRGPGHEPGPVGYKATVVGERKIEDGVQRSDHLISMMERFAGPIRSPSMASLEGVGAGGEENERTYFHSPLQYWFHRSEHRQPCPSHFSEANMVTVLPLPARSLDRLAMTVDFYRTVCAGLRDEYSPELPSKSGPDPTSPLSQSQHQGDLAQNTSQKVLAMQGMRRKDIAQFQNKTLYYLFDLLFARLSSTLSGLRTGAFSPRQVRAELGSESSLAEHRREHTAHAESQGPRDPSFSARSHLKSNQRRPHPKVDIRTDFGDRGLNQGEDPIPSTDQDHKQPEGEFHYYLQTLFVVVRDPILRPTMARLATRRLIALLAEHTRLLVHAQAMLQNWQQGKQQDLVSRIPFQAPDYPPQSAQEGLPRGHHAPVLPDSFPRQLSKDMHHGVTSTVMYHADDYQGAHQTLSHIATALGAFRSALLTHVSTSLQGQHHRALSLDRDKGGQTLITLLLTLALDRKTHSDLEACIGNLRKEWEEAYHAIQECPVKKERPNPFRPPLLSKPESEPEPGTHRVPRHSDSGSGSDTSHWHPIPSLAPARTGGKPVPPSEAFDPVADEKRIGTLLRRLLIFRTDGKLWKDEPMAFTRACGVQLCPLSQRTALVIFLHHLPRATWTRDLFHLLLSFFGEYPLLSKPSVALPYSPSPKRSDSSSSPSYPPASLSDVDVEPEELSRVSSTVSSGDLEQQRAFLANQLEHSGSPTPPSAQLGALPNDATLHHKALWSNYLLAYPQAERDEATYTARFASHALHGNPQGVRNDLAFLRDRGLATLAHRLAPAAGRSIRLARGGQDPGERVGRGQKTGRVEKL